MEPKVSIIIPCYNSIGYLQEALDSINFSDNLLLETIIVDDGSDNEEFKKYLQQLQYKEKIKVLQQPNGGPASARNRGIKEANGKYIFFLDSDNRLLPGYLQAAFEIMESDASIGIVYGQPVFFGRQPHQRFRVQAFDKELIIHENYIDMCCMLRRKVFDEVGLLDEDKTVIGHEDWEYWLRLCQTAWRFHFINKPCFEYRLRSGSLIEQSNSIENYNRLLQYLFNKYPQLYYNSYLQYKSKSRKYDFDSKHPVRALLKNIFK